MEGWLDLVYPGGGKDHNMILFSFMKGPIHDPRWFNQRDFFVTVTIPPCFRKTVTLIRRQ